MHDLRPRLFSADRFKLQPPDTYVHSVTRFLSLYSLFITTAILLRMATQSLSAPVEVQALKAPTVTPSPQAVIAVVAEQPPAPHTETDPIAEREAIHRYISTIFRGSASTAYAISLAEGKARSLYKGEVVYDPKAIRKTSSEYSVGIFQINIESEYAKVHFDRVPGKTTEEKVSWLQDPYNNTLFAYWVYSTHENFEPWTSYTGGKYLAYLP
jgi:hypothetical protein